MKRWIIGSRPRTLPAAVVPVALGAVVACGDGPAIWWRAFMAAAVSLALQVGVNFANDYSDGVRGTDDVRVGPTRLVASGLAKAGEVKSAALVSFGVAAACGLTLAVATSWWLLAVGASSILAAWFYTGGPRPYGYLGLGEVFVFTFFGLVATIGTTYVTIERMPVESWIFGCVAGFLACALLVTNNLRDIPGDAAVGKRTLAVRIGSRHTRHLFVALLGASFLAIVISGFVRPGALLGLVSVPLAVRPARRILSGADGRDLIAVLGETGRVQIAVGIAVSVGVMLFG